MAGELNSPTPCFDTDSSPFAVDPGASATISNSREDFGELHATPNLFLKGVGGKVPVKGMGTLKWNLLDDTGKGHTMVIEQAYYVPEAPLSLLCPQQWAKQRATAKGTKDKPQFVTMASNAKLSWIKGKTTITIPYDQVSNLPIS